VLQSPTMRSSLILDPFIMDWLFISAAVVLIYDYFLTIILEIRVIWFPPWSYTTVLFLMVRYLSIADTCLFLYTLFPRRSSAAICAEAVESGVWLLGIVIVLAEAILMIRTWAVWHRNRLIGLALLFLMLCVLALECFVMIKLTSTLEHVQADKLAGCAFDKSLNPLTVIIHFCVLIFIETVALVLMVISAFRTYSSGNNCALSIVIHKDGIMYYVYLLGFTIVNVILSFFSAFSLASLTFLQGVLYSVFTCRIVLNIRSVAWRNTTTELHTTLTAPEFGNEHQLQDSADSALRSNDGNSQ